MKRKVTHDTKTVFSESDVKTEVTDDETPVQKKARNNRQGSSSDTISMEVVSPLGAPIKYLERNGSPSLWIALPRAEKPHILEFVLEEQLIDVTPERFKVFLTDWLLSVQQQMIQMLENDDLRKTIKSASVKYQETLNRHDDRLYFFLLKVLKFILETQTFVIFEEERSWMCFIRRFTKNWKLKEEIDETVLTSVFATLSKNAKREMSSFFPGSQRQKTKEVKVYYCHILRFVLKFTFNTLRHVFKLKPINWYYFYDGELEEEHDEHDVKPQVVPFPTLVSYDSSSGTIKKNPTTTVSFAAPSVQVAEEQDVKPQLPLAVPLAEPVYEPKSHLLPKEAVPTVPPPHFPSSLTGDDETGTSRSLNSPFVSDESVPPNWIDMVLQHNAILKSQEARWEARYQELKAEIQELKEEKRRGLI
ncbi:unnamed protein product [Caenorhabditis nigoni]